MKRRLALISTTALILSACASTGEASPASLISPAAAVHCPVGTYRQGNRCLPKPTPAPTPTPTPAPPPTPPVISVVNSEANESLGLISVYESRSGDLTQPSSFAYATVPGTAKPGVNYTSESGTGTFAAGSGTTSFMVPIIPDGVVTGDLAFGVQLSNLTNGTLGTNGTITIHNADQPPPTTQTCPDGSVIPLVQTCPVPAPAPGPAYVPDPTVAPSQPPLAASETIFGMAAIPSNFDIALGTSASTVPASNAPDVLGAFRFICGPGQLLADDPILFPGQPGKSHLHQFYGNVTANANSTFESLRAAGASTCNYFPNDLTGVPSLALNRSAYWMPAMFDGKGNVVRPDYVATYYKRRPISDPNASDPTSAQFEGYGVPVPNGLKFIFGWDPTGLNSAPTGAGYFNCQGPTAVPGHYATIGQAALNCPAGQGNQLGAVIEAPNCWDGKNLDSTDHRSHVGYSSYGYWGYLKCDAKHPFLIPTFTLGAWYSVLAGDDPAKWSLSSDAMAPGQAAGSTLHADWFGAWDNPTLAEWTAHCIDQMLNCTAGNMGSGRSLNGASVTPAASFLDGVWSFGMVSSPHLVPIPATSM